MCKRTNIFISGLLCVLLFTKCAFSTDNSDEDDFQSDDLVAREELNSNEFGVKLGEPLQAGEIESPLLQKRQSFTTAQVKFQNEMLRSHNAYRSGHCAAALQLDNALSRSAQNYAQRLANTNSFQHSGTSGVGATAVKAWYDEINQYNFNRGGFSMGTGHFTQVVWKNSRKLGVGVAFSSRGAMYVVAQYTPPGNYAGQYQQNVRPKNIC